MLDSLTCAPEPLVHVVIPVYNGELTLRACLESLVAQNYRAWRATIVNNASTDGTAKIADEYQNKDARFSALHCSDFVSQAQNYNRAAGQISPHAKYALILEADNTLGTEFIEKTVELAESYDKIGLVAVEYEINGAVRLLEEQRDRKILSGLEAGKLMLSGRLWPYSPTTVLFRVAALPAEEVMFPEDIPWDDWDLFLRILAKWDLGLLKQKLASIGDDSDTTFGTLRRLDFIAAQSLFQARRYSNVFLEFRDAQNLRDKKESDYYLAVGKSFLRGRINRRYIEFHRGLFRIEGGNFSILKLLPGIMTASLIALTKLVTSASDARTRLSDLRTFLPRS